MHVVHMHSCFEMNVAGRVMLLLTQIGLRDARSLRIYQCAVIAAVRSRVGKDGEPDLVAVEPEVEAQLALLERALLDRAAARIPPAEAAVAAVMEPAPHMVPAADGSVALDAEDAVEQAAIRQAAGADPAQGPTGAVRPARPPKTPSGYVPPARSMEEKLHDERVPIQDLLREDCVSAGLIDADTAKQLVFGMSGKTSQEAEQEIVEFLRQRLQDQVKGFIRKAKGGPWGDPLTQEMLRQDIHSARSVRSILMLSRQVLKEYQTWRNENGRHGILGLFSPRRRGGRSR